MDILDGLKLVESRLLDDSLQDLDDCLSDIDILHHGRQLFDGDLSSQDLLSERYKCDWINAKDADQERLETVSVHESLSKEVGVGKEVVFDAFGRDVFALGELEEVLDAVDDCKASHVVDRANVSSVEPSLRIDGFGSLFGSLVILLEDGGTTKEKFTTGPTGILVGVAHLGNILETGFGDVGWGTAGTSGVVLGELTHSDGISLGQTVTLHKVIGKGNTEEREKLGGDGGRARDHAVAAVESDSGLDLVTPDSVVDGVRVGAGGSHVGKFGVDNVAGEGTLYARSLDGSSLDRGTEALEKTGDGEEDGGSELLDIVGKTENVAVEETNGGTSPKGNVLTETPVDVSERQVGQHYVLILHMDNTSVSTTCCCYRVGVGEHDTLGGASGAGCVVDGDSVLWFGEDEFTGVLDTEFLNLRHGVNLQSLLLGPCAEKRSLAATWKLSLIEFFNYDNELESWASGSN